MHDWKGKYTQLRGEEISTLSLMSTCKQKRDHGQVLESSHLSLYKITASAFLKAFIPF